MMKLIKKMVDTEGGGGRGKFIGATGDARPLIFEIAEQLFNISYSMRLCNSAG